MLKWLQNIIIANFTLDNLRKLIYSVGGRRFIVTMLVQASATVLVWYAKIPPDIYRDIIIGCSGLFIAGTTFQKNKTEPKKGD